MIKPENIFDVKTSRDLQSLSDAQVLQWAYLNSAIYNRIFQLATQAKMEEGSSEKEFYECIMANLVIALKSCQEEFVELAMKRPSIVIPHEEA